MTVGRIIPQTTTASSESFSIALAWLYRCLIEHPGCVDRTESSSDPPTRLINVRTDGDLEHLCLHTSCPSDAKLNYVTLSYCWEGALVMRLTTATIQIFTEGVSTESPPQTFQDAVVITRRLGYRYLWIGALCNAPDCTENWARESSTMDRFYSNAVLTIAAF